MGEIGAIWIKLGAKITEFEKGMSDAEKAMEKVGAKFQSIGAKLTVTGAAITGAIGLIIAKTTKLGDEFDDLSQRTGISTEVLSSFTLAVNKTDLGMAGFATSLKFLANNMADANTKGGEAAAKFAALGVAFKNADGSLRPLDQVMLDVADKFKALPDGAQKSALAVDLFGRAGTGMIHMLNLGRDGLQAEMDKARELGLVFSTEAAGSCDKFSESLVDLQGGLQGAFNQIGAALIPALTSLANKVTEIIAKVTAWAKEHPGLTKVIGGTALGLGALLTALGTVAISIGTVLKILPTLTNGIQALGKIAANPIVITITIAIPVLLKALDDFKKSFKGAMALVEQEGAKVGGFEKFMISLQSAVSKVTTGFDMNKVALAKMGAGMEGALPPARNLTGIIEALGKTTPDTGGSFKSLKGNIEGADKSSREIVDTFIGMNRGATLLRDVMQGFSGELQDSFIPAARKMDDILRYVPSAMTDAGDAAGELEWQLKTVGDALGYSAETIRVALYNIQADFLAMLGIIVPKIQSLPGAIKPVAAETHDIFAGLWNDIATGFGNTFQKSLEEAWGFMRFLDEVWKNIKTSFFRMIGEMVTDWLINGVKGILGGAKSMASGVAGATQGMASAVGSILTGLVSAIGTIITTLATALSTGIVAIATGIAGAITILATAIATAATTLAAAAGPLAIVLGIAIAAYAAVAAINKWLGGGKQTDVTYWLKLIKDLTQESHDFLFANLQDKLNFYADKLNDIGLTLLNIRDDKFNAALLKLDGLGTHLENITKLLDSIAKNTAAALTQTANTLTSMMGGMMSGGAYGNGPNVPTPGKPYIPGDPRIGPHVPLPDKPYVPGDPRIGPHVPLPDKPYVPVKPGKPYPYGPVTPIKGWDEKLFNVANVIKVHVANIAEKMGALGTAGFTALTDPRDISGPIIRMEVVPELRDINRTLQKPQDVRLTFNINALDAADVERITRGKIVPILQKVFDHNGLHPRAANIQG
jgi:hypothetical protein